ncbi:TM2 domain-containing protein [Polaribacter sp. NJDZ03]|uniref:TM2 domain-containing protein n=1 Tax=Polaribacter sp. NJDZ03 TaxID=2855841 RepID=UPI001C4A4578|nr:NINE protein [Polaribacter sp. NJDZ03]
MKNKKIAQLLLFFPLTGIFGIHQLYLGSFKKFLIRLIVAILTLLIGGIVFWIYDIMNFNKQFDSVKNDNQAKIDEIIQLLDEGKLGSALKKFIKTGKTKIYVKEIIKQGKGEVIVKHFAKSEKDKKDLERLISKGDTDSLVIYLSTYYAKSKIQNILNV